VHAEFGWLCPAPLLRGLLRLALLAIMLAAIVAVLRAGHDSIASTAFTVVHAGFPGTGTGRGNGADADIKAATDIKQACETQTYRPVRCAGGKLRYVRVPPAASKPAVASRPQRPPPTAAYASAVGAPEASDAAGRRPQAPVARTPSRRVNEASRA